MPSPAVTHRHLSPSPAAAPFLGSISIGECVRDVDGVWLPRPAVHLIVRIGAPAHRELDVHALGVRAKVHRKRLRRGQRTVIARLQPGASESIFGVGSSAIADRIVPLEELWGPARTARLLDRLAGAEGTLESAAILQSALAERIEAALPETPRARLAIAAAGRLENARVHEIAEHLGVSERHLRRVFREAVGVAPKTFARLTRFRRALSAARNETRPDWASIAAGAGYYDQAHLIAEFRAIAGTTPRALLAEIGDDSTFG